MKNLLFYFLLFTISCGGTAERTVLPQPTTETEAEETEIEKTETEETKTEKPEVEKKQKKLKKEVKNTLKEYGYEK